MGLDRLMLNAAAVTVAAVAGCGHGGDRPARLLDGRPAAEFAPVPGSVVATARVLQLSALADCLSISERATVPADTPVVERVGVSGRSLTFASRTRVFACDGGIDPAGERPAPWCGAVFGELEDGRPADPRLDVLCVDRAYEPLAYAFVDPVPGARWIGVRQDGYVELYEVLGGLPVRIATTCGIDLENDHAAFSVTQYDAEGRELLRGELEAAVAG